VLLKQQLHRGLQVNPVNQPPKIHALSNTITLRPEIDVLIHCEKLNNVDPREGQQLCLAVNGAEHYGPDQRCLS
jgi:hypothetical protein